MSDFVLAEFKKVAARPPVADVLARARERARTTGITTEQMVQAVRSGRDG